MIKNINEHKNARGLKMKSIEMLMTLFILTFTAPLFANFEISVKEISVGENVKEFEVIDYDGDGKKDVIYHSNTGDLKTAIQKDEDVNGSIVDQKDISIGEDVQKYQVKDYDSDGKKDVIYLKSNGDVRGGLQTEEGAGGSITNQVDLLIGENVKDFEVETFNSDTRPDIIFSNQSGDLKVALQGRNYTPVFSDDGSGDGSQWVYQTITTNSFIRDSEGVVSFSGAGEATIETAENLAFDLTNFDDPVINVELYQNIESNSSVFLEIKTEAEDWTSIKEFSSFVRFWKHYSFSLLAFKGSQSVKLRFRVVSNHVGTYFKFRNLKVQDKYIKKYEDFGNSFSSFESEDWKADEGWMANSSSSEIKFNFNNPDDFSNMVYQKRFDLTAYTNPYLIFSEYMVYDTEIMTVKIQVNTSGSEDGWEDVYVSNSQNKYFTKKEVSLVPYQNEQQLEIRFMAHSYKINSHWILKNIKIESEYIEPLYTGEFPVPASSSNWSMDEGFNIYDSNTIQFTVNSQNTPVANNFLYVVDLTTFSDPVMTFEVFRRGNAVDAKVQVSPSGKEGSWVDVFQSSIAEVFLYKSISLSSFATETNLHIRLLVQSNHIDTDWRIRNFKIGDKLIKQSLNALNYNIISGSYTVNNNVIHKNGSNGWAQPNAVIGDIMKPIPGNGFQITKPGSNGWMFGLIEADTDPLNNTYLSDGTEHLMFGHMNESDPQADVWEPGAGRVFPHTASAGDIMEFRIMGDLSIGYFLNGELKYITSTKLDHNKEYYMIHESYYTNVNIDIKINTKAVIDLNSVDWRLGSNFSLPGENIIEFSGDTKGVFVPSEYLYTIDLTKYTNPVMIFSNSTRSTLMTGVIQVSTTGEPNSWIDVFSSSGEAAYFQRKTIALSEYANEDNLHIRFYCKSLYHDVYWKIKNLEIKSSQSKGNYIGPSLVSANALNWDLSDAYSFEDSNTVSFLYTDTGGIEAITNFNFSVNMTQYPEAKIEFEDYLRVSGSMMGRIQASTTGDDGTWVDVYSHSTHMGGFEFKEASLGAFSAETSLHLRLVVTSRHNDVYWKVRNFTIK